ncbi:glycosyltransferase family 39 protein [Pseudonocardia alni subsp. carboxydivorans]|uniref:Dolichyl-phosphate-mannose-protein mannosyltransferase n=1 Tax=Pseudonocardia alni subsp. carboxydivorans TaxID=415010 RepID=A0ABU9AIF9_PSEA5
MTALLDRPAPPADTAAVSRPATRAVFVAALTGYLLLGAALVFGFDSIMEDALARVSAASTVTAALDPKLAAVGFVWTPLPALLMVPFAPLRAVWPGLVSTGFLAVLVSAPAMAGVVAGVHGIAHDLRVRRSARAVLTAGTAVAPLLVVYATNGMTEALLLVFLVLAVRRLLRWTAGPGRHTDLVAAGLFLGLGYLARYEAVVAAAAATTLVAAVTLHRTRYRPWAAVGADVLLVGGPAVVAFVLWAGLSWLTVGSPFEQFTSAYGNAALTAGGTREPGGLADVAVQLGALAPLGAVVAVAAAVVALRRRDPAAAVPVAVLGSVLAFEWALRAGGQLFGFLRYQIAVLPLVTVLLALLLAGGAARPGRLRAVGATLLAAAVLGTSAWGSAALVLTDPVRATQEYHRIAPVVAALTGGPPAAGDANGMWAQDREVAERIDALDLPDGSVLADSGAAFAVLAASARPSAFLVTSDDGFDAALADPAGQGIRYVLRNDSGGVDAVRARHPDPSGWTRVASWPGATRFSYTWSLWRVG